MSSATKRKKSLFMGVQASFDNSGSADVLEAPRSQPGNSITGRLNPSSKEHTIKSERIVYLKRTLLKASPCEEKVYDITKPTPGEGRDLSLEALALDISRRGIQTPLTVVPLDFSDEGMTYEVISGHRRCAAYDMAVAEHGYSDPDGGIPCILSARAADGHEYETMEAMILDNLQREKSDYERMMEIVELKKCIEQRRSNGEDIPNVRTRVKEMLGVSDTEITRFDKIYSGLSPELMRDFHEGRIASTVAYELAKMEPQYQQYVAERWDRNSPPTLAIGTINAIVSEYLANADITENETDPPQRDEPKAGKPVAPMPNSINEGVAMLDAAFAGIRDALTAPVRMDNRTKARLLKKISKQMSQLIALQNELAMLGLPVGNRNGE